MERLQHLCSRWDPASRHRAAHPGHRDPGLPASDSGMKKVGETTSPFRYDLNQIPYDYTVEVTNRFKGLDLRSWHPVPSLHGKKKVS